jgi:glycosyltransferase involved in cell wall biosynthesis
MAARMTRGAVFVATRAALGGSEKRLPVQIEVLQDAGFHCTLVVGRGSTPEGIMEIVRPGVDVVVVPELGRPIRPFRDALAVARLRRILSVSSPDVVNAVQQKAAALTRIANAGRSPMVVQVVMSPFRGAGVAQAVVALIVERCLARFGVLYVFVSNELRDEYLRFVPGVRKRLHEVIRSPVAGASGPKSRRCREGPAKIGFMGTPAPRKGFATLLSALDIVCKVIPVELDVAGSGFSDRDVRDRGFPVRLRGYVDPVEWIAEVDVVVVPSRSEGLSQTVLRSAMAGTRLVATVESGVMEVLVRDPQWVPVIVGTSPEAVGDGILVALSEPGVRAGSAASWSEWENSEISERWREAFRRVTVDA